MKFDCRKTPEQMEKSRIRTRAWVKVNYERKRAADAAYREANRERMKGYKREWYLRNREEMLRASAERYRANPEPKRQQALKWAKDNPKAMYLKTNARRIKRRETLKGALSKAQAGKCAYCRERLIAGHIHIDHIMPRALGGTNERSNLQLTCDVCNFSKNRRHPIDFARSLGRLL